MSRKFGWCLDGLHDMCPGEVTKVVHERGKDPQEQTLTCDCTFGNHNTQHEGKTQ